MSAVTEEPTSMQAQRSQLLQRLSHAQQIFDYKEISTLIVHIIRSYLKDNHFTQAYQFLLNAQFPSADKVDQHVFGYFTYYKALIFAMYEEYNQSLDELSTIMRISNDQITSFHLHVYRLFIIVSLLLGNIPDRSIFEIPLIKRNLNPVYLNITSAVRDGRVDAFTNIIETPENMVIFEDDNIHSLVKRLLPTIVRAGLIKITKVYTTISIEKIATVLNIPLEDIHSVVNKAIFDGVIHAKIDENDVLHIIENTEQYTTNCPKKMLVEKINYCLGIYEQCQQGKRYLDKQADTANVANPAEKTKNFLI